MPNLVHREALEQLQAEGVRGLRGFPTELRFRKKEHPELWELEILAYVRRLALEDVELHELPLR